MTREQLPDDGARYDCGFETFIEGESWRCPKKATHAIDEVTFNRYDSVKGKLVHLHGRAMCETHLNVIEGWI